MEIGSTLREARIRAGISMEEIEDSTKIRAKYLRAIENEEWGLLPGPAYVASFLRGYAEALGLDGRAFVDEYRRRFEAPSEQEMAQYGEPVISGTTRPRPRLSPPRPPGWAIGAAVVALLVLALGVLGSLGDSSEEPVVATTGTTATATREATTRTRTHPRRRRKPAAPRLARVTLRAQAPVWACLVDATGATRVNARVLEAGDHVGPFKSRRFSLTLGNGSATISLNGKRLQVPEVSEPIGYSLTPKGRRPLAAGKRPTCA